MANSAYNSIYPCFQHWVWKGNIKLIADPHFGDYDFKGIKTNELWTLNQINSGLHSGDTLIVLGDCGVDWPKYSSQIKKGVRKVLIAGNHDIIPKLREYFDEIYEGGLQIAPKIYLSHEPIKVLGALNIHGHTHNEGLKLTYGGLTAMKYNEKTNSAEFTRYDSANLCICGEADEICYKPINLKELIQRGLLKKIEGIHRLAINEAVNRKSRSTTDWETIEYDDDDCDYDDENFE